MHSSTLIILGHIAVVLGSLIVLSASFIAGNDVIGMSVLLGALCPTLLNLAYLVIAPPSNGLTLSFKRLLVKSAVVITMAFAGISVLNLPLIPYALTLCVTVFFLHVAEGLYCLFLIRERSEAGVRCE